MSRWLAVIVALALPAAAQDRNPRCRSDQGRSSRGFMCGQSLAFFEFAPSSGAGLGAPCACAAVTGAKGEAVTWTRASTATCTKSASESSIANGDLVTCAANQPRVMSLGGPLGVLVESSRTNAALQSEAFDNAAWTSAVLGGAAAPVITADQATSPQGTLVAERVQISALTAGQESLRFQAGPAGTYTGSFYVRGVSGPGTIYTYSGSGLCFACPYVATAWSRCVGTSMGGASANFTIGASTAFAGCSVSSTTAIDAYVTDVQVEIGPYATSYIPTTTVAVTRAADQGVASVSIPQQPISMAWTSGVALPASGTPDRIGVVTRALAGSGDFTVSYFQTQYRADAVGAASNSVTGAGTSVPGDRWALSHTVGGVLSAYKNGTQTGTATLANTLTSATVVGIGGSPAGVSQLDGVVSRICIDPDPNRCR